MIEAVVSEHVNAPADRVWALYRDPGNWVRLFPGDDPRRACGSQGRRHDGGRGHAPSQERDSEPVR